MLALARKTGERIVITHGGETLVLVVTTAEGGTARLGLEAPRTFNIVREELIPERAA